MKTVELAAMLLSLALLLCACGVEGDATASRAAAWPEPSQEQLQRDLERLSNARIYFNHMSVGRNILEGISRLDGKLRALDLREIEGKSAGALPEAYFAHSYGGLNRDPRSKIDAFAIYMDEYISPKPDVAFMKFCYVDVVRDTDVKALFAYYRETLDALEEAHRETRFVHFTVPLIAPRTGKRSRIKQLLGVEIEQAEDGVKRQAFNELVRAHYEADSVFDLALIEATGPGGRLEQLRYQGKTYPALVPSYSHDGRHLNETGQDHVAPLLVHSLAKAIAKRDGRR